LLLLLLVLILLPRDFERCGCRDDNDAEVLMELNDESFALVAYPSSSEEEGSASASAANIPQDVQSMIDPRKIVVYKNPVPSRLQLTLSIGRIEQQQRRRRRRRRRQQQQQQQQQDASRTGSTAAAPAASCLRLERGITNMKQLFSSKSSAAEFLDCCR
jgi:hypothetical protein